MARLIRHLIGFLLTLVFLAVPHVLSAQDVHVKYLAHTTSTSELDLYRELAKSFQEQHPGIEVEILAPVGPWLERLKVMIAGGTPPDAIFAPNWWIPELVMNDLLLDITKFAANDPQWHDDDFFPVTVEQTFYQGRRYAVPRHFSPMLIFFNRTLFQQSGLDDPPADWTWDEFRDYARRLTRHSGDQTDYWGFLNVRGQELAGNAYMIPLVRSFGGRVLSEDGLDLELTSEVSSSAVQWFIDLALEDRVSPTPAETEGLGGLNLTAAQRTAMWLDIFAGIMNTRSAEVSFDWDVAQVPTGPAGRVNRAASGVHAIVRDSAHPQAAWEWIKFLGSSEAQQAFAASGLVMGARIDSAIVDTLMVENEPPNNLRLFMEAALDAQPYPATPFYNEAVAAIQPAMASAWQGNQPFRLAIQEVRERVEAILKQ